MSGTPLPWSGLVLAFLVLLVIPGTCAAIDETGEQVGGLQEVAGISFSATPGDDVVLQWNEMTLDLIRSEMTGTQRASRTMAIVQSSMYDAINGIQGKYNPYRITVAAPAGASADAAGAAAAYTVLTSVYPARVSDLDTLYEAQLAVIPDGQSKTDGIAYGRSVANAIMMWRSMDGSMAMVPYTPGTLPGEWRPTPMAFAPAMAPQWRYVTPWLMTSQSQFRQAGPAGLTSAEYAAAYDETKALGEKNSATRTQEQTDIGRFWSDGMGNNTPLYHFNSVAQQVSRERHLSLDENARLFALLDMALADGVIAGWDMKYEYNWWRPVTAIRLGDSDTNPLTQGDPGWEPLVMTPPFQEYISTHSLLSGNGAELLARFFGTDAIPVTRSSEMFPALPPRSYTTLSSMAEEIGISRIYGGIHFSYSNEDGRKAGKELAHYAFAGFLNRKGMAGPDVDPVISGTMPLKSCKVLSNAPLTSSEVKFEAKKDFAYGKTTALALPGGGSVEMTVSKDGKSFSYSSDATIFCAMVKGGAGANMYNYVPYDVTTNDDGLMAPLNRGGNNPEIGSVQFCFAS